MITPIQHTLGEGRSIISAALASERWRIGNVCDRNEDLCRERQKEISLPRYAARYEDLLSDSEIDTIAIYTPDEQRLTALCRRISFPSFQQKTGSVFRII